MDTSKRLKTESRPQTADASKKNAVASKRTAFFSKLFVSRQVVFAQLSVKSRFAHIATLHNLGNGNLFMLPLLYYFPEIIWDF